MATPLDSSAALEAQLFTNRMVRVEGAAASVMLTNDVDELAPASDPRIRFSYKYVTGDSAAFTVGFRQGGASTFDPGVGVTIRRDGTDGAGGTVNPADVLNTWTGVVDWVIGEGVVHVCIKATNLDTLAGGTDIEVCVDPSGGKGVELYDFRLDLAGDA